MKISSLLLALLLSLVLVPSFSFAGTSDSFVKGFADALNVQMGGQPYQPYQDNTAAPATRVYVYQQPKAWVLLNNYGTPIGSYGSLDSCQEQAVNQPFSCVFQ